MRVDKTNSNGPFEMKIGSAIQVSDRFNFIPIKIGLSWWKLTKFDFAFPFVLYNKTDAE